MLLLVVPCPADRQCPDVATVNDQDTYGYSALHAAASYGHADVLAYLISKGGAVFRKQASTLSGTQDLGLN